MNMTLKVEFIAGTQIENAVREAKKQAINLDMAYVKFNFNRVEFSIGQTADVESVIKDFNNKEEYICHA